MPPEPSPVPALAADLVTAARLFRLGMVAAANVRVVDVVDGLATHLESPSSAAAAARLSAAVQEVVAAQGRGDGLRIADLFEFELLPLVTAGA